MPDAPVLWSIASAAALVTAAATAWGAVVVRGSTAVPAACWAVLAAGALAVEAGVRTAGGLADPAAAAAVRLVVTALGVCPAMALLGAKRPQHGVWQFIVAALAVVIALPALSALLVRPGTMPDVGPLWPWFLLALLAVGWMNFVATRRAVAASLIVAGQGLLAREFLPLVAAPATAAADATGAVALAAGALLAAAQAVVSGRRPAGGAAWIDAPFLALRETLGAAWALRIAERFNAVAADRGWPCRLGFAGLDPAAVDGPWRTAADRAFRALARRFATADWLARHAAAEPRMAPTDDGR